METAHLLRSPRNAQRLQSALRRAEQGRTRPGTVGRFVERRWVKRDPKRVAVFQAEFREDLRFWVKTERATAIRVLDLVEAVMRHPFQGLGKPQPLRYVLAGCWSRRVSQEHRLVYRVTDEAFDFLQARYHY